VVVFRAKKSEGTAMEDNANNVVHGNIKTSVGLGREKWFHL